MASVGGDALSAFFLGRRRKNDPAWFANATTAATAAQRAMRALYRKSNVASFASHSGRIQQRFQIE
jgi:hypothetical protein